jgi:uncharacterized lipoprotein YmbA
MSVAPVTRALAALLCAAALSACSWRSPSVQLYTMSAVADSTAAAGDAADGPAVAVGPATLPRFLLRPQIVNRSDANRLDYDEYNRWGGSLDADFLRVLGDDLGTLLPSTRIVVYPTDPPFAAYYRVRLDVQQFDGSLGGTVTLRARWTISGGNGGPPLRAEQSAVQIPTASPSHRDLVAAHSAAVADLARQIAAAIAALEAAGALPAG